MATQRPISTISYNTESFLREKLDSWVNAHILQAYMYICHKGEDGDKDHIHLRIEPNKRIDPMDLSDQLKEYQIGKEKPLGCRPFRPSKEEDWILYAVHDKEYLKLKYAEGERGEKLEYQWEDIKASEGYDVEIAYIRAKQSLDHSSASLMKAIKAGKNASSLVIAGENPFIVKSCLTVLHQTEYEDLLESHVKLSADFEALQRRLSSIEDALDRAGFEAVEDENGNMVISSYEK